MRVTVAYGTAGMASTCPTMPWWSSPPSRRRSPTRPGRSASRPAAPRPARRWPTWSPPAGPVAVVFPDLTRPMPNTTVLPPLLAELERAGAGPDRVELLCATGTHRQATPAEMADAGRPGHRLPLPDPRPRLGRR